jgi:hypothetical protein
MRVWPRTLLPDCHRRGSSPRKEAACLLESKRAPLPNRLISQGMVWVLMPGMLSSRSHEA